MAGIHSRIRIDGLRDIPFIYFRSVYHTKSRLMVFDRMEGPMHVHRTVAEYGHPGYAHRAEVFAHSDLTTRTRAR